MNNQHANTEAARRLAAAQIGGEDQVLDARDLEWVAIGNTNEQHTETLERMAEATHKEVLAVANQAVSGSGMTTAQDARQRIRDAAIGDVVPLDTFPARAVSPVVAGVKNDPSVSRINRQVTQLLQYRTFERTDAGWKRVK